jgi:hypothetical protein
MKTLLQHQVWTKLLAVIFSLSFLLPLSVAEARRIKFNVPEDLKPAPGRREAAASREEDSSCIINNQRLVAIVPQSNVGLTTQANPMFFFYVPKTSASALELVVQDNNKFIRQTYKPSTKSGIVAIPLTQLSLEEGKQYKWYFSIVCDQKARSRDKVVNGAIKRIANPQLMKKLENATPTERVNLYAEAGVWQDSLASLVQLLSSRPNDSELKADWEALLKAEGVKLDKVAPELLKEPLLQGEDAPQPI